jgi:hypothetical protein
MEPFVLPYSGTLLVTHLAAYGLAVALDAAGIDAFVGHDPAAQSFEPLVVFAGQLGAARAAVRASAQQLETIVENDVEDGKAGNDRRATIWARVSLEKDSERQARIVALRTRLVEAADGDAGGIAVRLLAGIGSPLTWGPQRLKSSAGATALDGVIGNHTSDFVRGVLRPMRRAAADADCDPFLAPDAQTPFDKTGWAPPGTRIRDVHQWLAALGLALLPVAHRQTARSRIPAWWVRPGGSSGITLPVLTAPCSVPRLRALLALRELSQIAQGADLVQPEVAQAAGMLRSYGIDEVVVFRRRDRVGAGSSVAFDFRRGERTELRASARLGT